MKKFLTVLALLAVALNFSSVRLWAEEIKADSTAVVSTDAVKGGSDAEIALENAAVADDQKAKTEVVAPVVAVPAADAAKAVVPAVTEEKKEAMGSVLPVTTQDQAKIS